MEYEIRVKLAAFMRDEYQMIVNPENALEQAIAVLDFFFQHLQETEPYAQDEIGLMDGARGFLESNR